MPDAAPGRNNTECESRLYQNVLAAKCGVDAALEARSRLVGLQEDPESVSARRQAFDNEQRALDQYLQALHDYNSFLLSRRPVNGGKGEPLSASHGELA